jgi:hypothetical protein
MAYPVTVRVDPALDNRNRLTTLFRLILAIPHLILVGGIATGVAMRDDGPRFGAEGGLLGAVALFLAVVSWFTLLFAGQHIAGIRQFTLFYLRWRARAIAYFMLLQDAYPPFGDAPYPATIDVVDPQGSRDRLTIAFRILLAIPHLIALIFVGLAWLIVTITAWFIILFSGTYPQALYDFAVGALQWRLRVEAYLLLLVDEYPPFSLR